MGPQVENRVWGNAFEVEGQALYLTQTELGWQIGREALRIAESDFQVDVSDNSYFHIELSGRRGKIEVGENSHIRVEITENTPKSFRCNLHVLKGEVFVSMYGKRNVSCKIIIENKVVGEFQDVDFVQRKYLKDQRFFVHRGELNLKYKNTKLRKDMWAKIAGTRVRVFEFPFTILTPFASDRVFNKAGSNVRTRFSWLGIPRGHRVQLEVSKNRRRFRKVWKSGIPSDKKESFYTFGIGVHYWRLSAIPKKGTPLKSPIYKLFVREEAPPLMSSPKQRQIVLARENELTRFQWNNQSRLENIILEVAEDRDFKRIRFTQRVLDTGFYAIDLNDYKGTYYWRVSGFRHDSSELLSSRPIEFSVVNSENDIPLDQVDLNFKDSAFDAEIASGEVVFHSIEVLGLDEQYIEIYRSKKLIQKIGLKKSIGAWNLTKPGFYTWKMKGRLGEKVFDLSKTRKFHVKSIDPLVFLQIAGDELRWSRGSKKIVSYKLELKSIQENEAVSEQLIAAKKNRVSLKRLRSIRTGAFQVRVKGLDSKGTVVAMSRSRFIGEAYDSGSEE